MNSDLFQAVCISQIVCCISFRAPPIFPTLLRKAVSNIGFSFQNHGFCPFSFNSSSEILLLFPFIENIRFSNNRIFTGKWILEKFFLDFETGAAQTHKKTKSSLK